MRGVRFGAYHSYDTWKLMLRKAVEVTPPKPKTHYVEIPGKDGSLDLSTAMTGKMRYEDREIRMVFVTLSERNEWPVTESDMLEKIHGQEMQFVLDDDPDYYYTGRVSVGDAVQGNKSVEVEVTAQVRPYKTSHDGTVKKL